MKKYVKPETELIKVNTRYNICSMSLTTDPAQWPACAPRDMADEDEDEEINWQWNPGRF